MTYGITDIEGIGPAMAEKLASAGIATTESLLDHCASAKGRRATAEKTGLSEQQLLKWANMADLMRISGVGEEYSELLEAAGVDTVLELRGRHAETLAARMADINESKRLVRQVPAAATVAKWIDLAKSMDPIITH